MIIVCTWKDPDFSCRIKDTREPRSGDFHHLPEDVQDRLRQMGADEYLTVEFDTDAMTARVRGVRV